MSNYIFPEFQGWAWNKTKTPQWSTTIYEADSGLETRVQKWSYPRYKIKLNYNFMTDESINSISLVKGELEELQGFFNSVGGTFNDFLFRDDVENACAKQSFGEGDGSTTEFQLVRSLPNWVEPVKGIVEAPVIYIDTGSGPVETTDFSFDNYGVIKFNNAPATGSILSWSGSYYFRCRFDNDELELNRDWDGLWSDIEVDLITVK
jgi:uncharacterized protein (TIGR02217 family)